MRWMIGWSAALAARLVEYEVKRLGNRKNISDLLF